MADPASVVYDDEPADVESTEPEEAAEIEEVEEAKEEETEADETETAEYKEKWGSVKLTAEEQEKFQHVLNKRLARRNEEFEAAQAEARELRDKVQKLQQPATPGQRPNVPPPPDPFEDGYAEKLAARDKAIADAAAFDGAEKARKDIEQRQRQEQAQQAQQAAVKQVQAFMDRGAKLGVKSDELTASIKVVSQSRLHPELVKDIVEDDKGPKILRYLAANLSEMEELRGMSPTKAAAYMATVIRPKALEKKAPSAPPPTERLKGAGAPQRDGPPGVIYE